MKCDKCGYINPSGSNYCVSCGHKIGMSLSSGVYSANTELRSLKCEDCGSSMSLSPSSKDIMFCPFCGSKKIMIESDYVKVEKHKTNAAVEMSIVDAAVEAKKADADVSIAAVKASEKIQHDKWEAVTLIAIVICVAIMTIAVVFLLMKLDGVFDFVQSMTFIMVTGDG